MEPSKKQGDKKSSEGATLPPQGSLEQTERDATPATEVNGPRGEQQEARPARNEDMATPLVEKARDSNVRGAESEKLIQSINNVVRAGPNVREASAARMRRGQCLMCQGFECCEVSRHRHHPALERIQGFCNAARERQPKPDGIDYWVAGGIDVSYSEYHRRRRDAEHFEGEGLQVPAPTPGGVKSFALVPTAVEAHAIASPLGQFGDTSATFHFNNGTTYTVKLPQSSRMREYDCKRSKDHRNGGQCIIRWDWQVVRHVIVYKEFFRYGDEREDFNEQCRWCHPAFELRKTSHDDHERCGIRRLAHEATIWWNDQVEKALSEARAQLDELVNRHQ